MSWGEAVRQTRMLAGDSTTWTFAALNEWKYPASPEFFVLADLFDAFATVNFKKPKPYPRPQPAEAEAERFGEVIRPADVADVMRAFGRSIPVAAGPAAAETGVRRCEGLTHAGERCRRQNHHGTGGAWRCHQHVPATPASAG